MKIAFLTDKYYPSFDANSLVVKNVCEELVKRGEEVFVLPNSFSENDKEYLDYEGVKVVRHRTFGGKDLLKSCLKKGKFFRAIEVFLGLVKSKLFKKIKLNTKADFQTVDFLDEWIVKNKIDVVVSTCLTVELSFPLLYLRKRGKLNCKWIFYMLDPFESHEYYRRVEKVKKLRRIQHEIMEKCDGVVSTDLIKQDTEKWETKEIIDKITVVGFPKITEPKYVSTKDDILLNSDKVNIVCTGSKNELTRNSDYTVNLCKSLDNGKYIFHFVGNGWAEEDYSVGNLHFYKPRSWQAAINLQLNADFLLNIGNSVVNQVPSKILEYICTGKPIINTYKHVACPSLKILVGYDVVNIREGNDLIVEKNKLEKYLETRHNSLSFDKIKQQYVEYSPEYVVELLLRCTNS